MFLGMPLASSSPRKDTQTTKPNGRKRTLKKPAILSVSLVMSPRAAFMSRDTPAAFMNSARAYPHPRLRAAESGIRVYEPEMARPRL